MRVMPKNKNTQTHSSLSQPARANSGIETKFRYIYMILARKLTAKKGLFPKKKMFYLIIFELIKFTRLKQGDIIEYIFQYFVKY